MQVYLSAVGILPNYMGLADACTPVARGVLSGCPTVIFNDCNQAILTPDTPTTQAGAFTLWQGPAGSALTAASTTPQAPARVQVSLQDSGPPVFTLAPTFQPMPVRVAKQAC